MKKNYSEIERRNHEDFLTIENRIRRDTQERIADALLREIEMMNNVLSNGRPILDQCYGDRFNKLIEARNKVWLKLFAMNKAVRITLAAI